MLYLWRENTVFILIGVEKLRKKKKIFKKS